jgi:DNA-nicking Smr family endonuclease
MHEGNSSLAGTTQNPLGNILEIRVTTYHLMDYLQRSMSDSSDNESDDLTSFREAVTGIRRLSHDKIGPHRRKLKPYPQQRHRDEQLALQESLAAPQPTADIEFGDELLFSRNGVQNSVMRKLRRGQYRIEAELDLHRLTAAQAHKVLVEFIFHSRRRQLRCVRIIHGKGLSSKDQHPVLKGKVNSWLQQWDDVLAFCSARQCDGGTGATYVLLRRPA